MTGTIIGLTIGFLLIILVFMSIYTVKQQTFAVVERFGKFSRISDPGFHLKWPIVERVAGRVSIRVMELNVEVKTKTADNVFVDLLIAVQYFVTKEKVWDAFYKLTNPQTQMESFVFDTVRAKVPHMKLDEVFEKKEDIAQDIEEKLGNIMPEFGYFIKTALVNDIVPDTKVASAMNEINAQERLRVAAEHKGEAEKILVVKAAEADAKSKELSGIGIANQRIAIVKGLKESVEDFQQAIEGVNAKDVMSLVLLTQYYDMLTDVGRHSNNNTILIPHSPGAVGDFQQQIISSLLAADKASKETGRSTD
ncbi:MAG: SPFH domain-containing protein [Dehalococcoidales bacterium]|jgi:regulator of protease activity HflC (stomatin/prohibitin superfamily)|nr:SPFH domain-containing protein [Dehalococcoidales bacterium]MDD5122190.1 SPFH domain-containing protein [Dehalococcoidales bacterium]MDX9802532.1 SPFH domain-containing protein [Dehalococcoidales bacterium]